MSTATTGLKAPFPFFGGKSRVSHLVWDRFGDVSNYVEAFAGSLAVMLQRPPDHTGRTETANDYDGYIANFWRALQHDPDAVTEYADHPVNENDLHARHAWLLQHRDSLRPMLEGDPDYYDAKIAGWWVWGICSWIGSGWCSGSGSWFSVDGRLIQRTTGDGGIDRKRIDIRPGGRGVQRKLVHLGNTGQGVQRQLVHLGAWPNKLENAIQRQMPRVGHGALTGVTSRHAEGSGLRAWMHDLAARLRHVRVTCGDWSRVCGPSPTFKLGLTGVFLDPPYGTEAKRQSDLYTHDDLSIAADTLRWCLDNGDNPLLRIALCGYAGEGHEPLEDAGWSVVAWKGGGGYGGQRTNGSNDNADRERIWFSPHCLVQDRPEQLELFGALQPGAAGV